MAQMYRIGPTCLGCFIYPSGDGDEQVENMHQKSGPSQLEKIFKMSAPF